VEGPAAGGNGQAGVPSPAPVRPLALRRRRSRLPWIYLIYHRLPWWALVFERTWDIAEADQRRTAIRPNRAGAGCEPGADPVQESLYASFVHGEGCSCLWRAPSVASACGVRFPYDALHYLDSRYCPHHPEQVDSPVCSNPC